MNRWIRPQGPDSLQVSVPVTAVQRLQGRTFQIEALRAPSDEIVAARVSIELDDQVLGTAELVVSPQAQAGFFSRIWDSLALAVRRVTPSGHLKLIGQRIGLNDQAVVACRSKWVGQPVEDAAIIVINLVGLAVHQSLGTDNLGTEGLANRLVSQAHAQNWQLSGQVFNARDRDARLVGSAGAR